VVFEPNAPADSSSEACKKQVGCYGIRLALAVTLAPYPTL
jgi:hypothetical protein